MPENNGNGRVKLGKLEGQMESVLTGLTDIKVLLGKNDDKTNKCIVEIAKNKTSITMIKKYVWGIISGIIVSAFWIIRGALK